MFCYVPNTKNFYCYLGWMISLFLIRRIYCISKIYECYKYVFSVYIDSSLAVANRKILDLLSISFFIKKRFLCWERLHTQPHSGSDLEWVTVRKLPSSRSRFTIKRGFKRLHEAFEKYRQMVVLYFTSDWVSVLLDIPSVNLNMQLIAEKAVLG